MGRFVDSLKLANEEARKTGGSVALLEGAFDSLAEKVEAQDRKAEQTARRNIAALERIEELADRIALTAQRVPTAGGAGLLLGGGGGESLLGPAEAREFGREAGRHIAKEVANAIGGGGGNGGANLRLSGSL